MWWKIFSAVLVAALLAILVNRAIQAHETTIPKWTAEAADFRKIIEAWPPPANMDDLKNFRAGLEKAKEFVQQAPKGADTRALQDLIQTMGPLLDKEESRLAKPAKS